MTYAQSCNLLGIFLKLAECFCFCGFTNFVLINFSHFIHPFDFSCFDKISTAVHADLWISRDTYNACFIRLPIINPNRPVSVICNHIANHITDADVASYAVLNVIQNNLSLWRFREFDFCSKSLVSFIQICLTDNTNLFSHVMV